jgi:two-component system, NarL family, nitrate/nitrite response regulator NarL
MFQCAGSDTMSNACAAVQPTIAVSHDARHHYRWNADGVQIRCLIVDDYLPFLDAARVLLEREGIAVVGTATTSAEALRLEQELRPDVVLVDIRLGTESGFDLAQRLSAKVILISTEAQDEYADEITASRAVGFIPKTRLSGSEIRRLAGESNEGDASAR